MIHRHWAAKYGVTAGILLVGSTLIFWIWKTRQESASPPLSFDGSSEALQQTVIVPTLDTPIPESKSAIWCASFQMAWNKLKNEIAKGSITVQGAEVIAERLNQAALSEDDLDEASSYSAAGFIKQGIIEKIQADMTEKFPNVPKPIFREDPQDVAIAYAYLKAEVKFQHRYLDTQEPAAFMVKGEDPTDVKSFGVPRKAVAKELRNQVELLYFDFGNHYYAIDLCTSSSPNQLVLASLPRKATLGETLSDLSNKSADYSSKEQPFRFGHGDILLVPNMHWRIEHHVKEIEGADKLLVNPSMRGTWIDQAIQVMEFKLDRQGAEVSSESKAITHKGGLDFMFNRPFLLYMKKRGAKHPFFVMWVDNAELLIKK
jgi:hypothetical protein